MFFGDRTIAQYAAEIWYRPWRVREPPKALPDEATSTLVTVLLLPDLAGQSAVYTKTE